MCMNASIRVPWLWVLMIERSSSRISCTARVFSVCVQVCDVFEYLLLGLKVMVVLGHFFTSTLVDQLSAQQPHGQTGHEHPNVRQENSDTIASVCTDNTTDTDSTSAHAFFFHTHVSLNRSADVQYSREHVTITKKLAWIELLLNRTPSVRAEHFFQLQRLTHLLCAV